VPLFGLLLPTVLAASLAFLLSGWVLPLLAVDWLLGEGYGSARRRRLLAMGKRIAWGTARLGLAARGSRGNAHARSARAAWALAWCVVAVAAVAGAASSAGAPGSLEVSLLDVGQGLAGVIRTHRHTLVYDTGPGFRSGFNTGEAVSCTLSEAAGGSVRSISLMISHADQDHAGGLSGLLTAVEARRISSGEPGEIQSVEREYAGFGLSARAAVALGRRRFRGPIPAGSGRARQQ
jgi:competence protein ComEC